MATAMGARMQRPRWAVWQLVLAVVLAVLWGGAPGSTLADDEDPSVADACINIEFPERAGFDPSPNRDICFRATRSQIRSQFEAAGFLWDNLGAKPGGYLGEARLRGWTTQLR